MTAQQITTNNAKQMTTNDSAATFQPLSKFCTGGFTGFCKFCTGDLFVRNYFLSEFCRILILYENE